MESNAPESVATPVDKIIAEFIIAMESGRAPDPAEYLTRYPQFAVELGQFFSGYRMMQGIAREPASHVDSTGIKKLEVSETNHPEKHAKQKRVQFPKTLGRYRLERLLGRGAMGAVFLARDLVAGRQVALKIPTLDMNDTPTLRERFYREARAAARLQHPNICTVFEVGEAKGLHFIAMAYVDGAPLSKFVKGAKLLTFRKIALTIKKLATALHEAHQAGIVHRDLKPSNIMINKSGEPVIMDFGLARLNYCDDDIRVTTTGMLIGSPAYMALEQVTADHDAVGPATDIYGLGVVMYELLTGRLPFTGNGKVLALIAEIQRDQPSPPSAFRADIPPELDQICLQMLEKSQADRQASMKEVALQLSDYLVGKFRVADSERGTPASPDSPIDDCESETIAWAPLAENEPSENQVVREEFANSDDEIIFATATDSDESPDEKPEADTTNVNKENIFAAATDSLAAYDTSEFDAAVNPKLTVAELPPKQDVTPNSKKTVFPLKSSAFAVFVLLLAVMWGTSRLGYKSTGVGSRRPPIPDSKSPPEDSDITPETSSVTAQETPRSNLGTNNGLPVEAPPDQVTKTLPENSVVDPTVLPRPELVLLSAPHRTSLINGGILLHLGVRNERRFPQGIKLRAQVFDNHERLLSESQLTDAADLRGRIIVKLAADQALPEQIRQKLTNDETGSTVVSEFISTSTVTGIRTIPIPVLPRSNHGLHDDLQVAERVQIRQNGLTELPLGSHIYGGVQFEIEDGVIELQSIASPALPPAAFDLRLDKMVTRLHFLLGCPVKDPDGMSRSAIAQIRVNFKSGLQESIPIEYGIHVESLLSGLGKTPLTKGTLAWIGANRDSLTRTATPRSVRLFVRSWTNPYPEERVDSIDILSTKSSGGLVCVAAALESSEETEAFIESVEIAPLANFADAHAVEWQQAQRDVADWALSKGAVVFISDRIPPVTKNDKLPIKFSVTSLSFESSEITDQDLARFALLTKLNYLKIKKGSVHGTGFKHLAGLPELSHIVLDGGQIQDDGLSHLVSLPALRDLELQEATITDSSLSDLAGCQRLEQLHVSRAVLTDVGISNLKAIKNLRGLWCDGDEACIKRIASELSLTDLTLQSPPNPAATVIELQKMSSLRHLTLLNVVGSERLLKALGKLNQLRQLTIGGFSKSNIVQLRGMLPGCKIQER